MWWFFFFFFWFITLTSFFFCLSFMLMLCCWCCASKSGKTDLWSYTKHALTFTPQMVLWVKQFHWIGGWFVFLLFIIMFDQSIRSTLVTHPLNKNKIGHKQYDALQSDPSVSKFNWAALGLDVEIFYERLFLLLVQQKKKKKEFL